jgi:hypothetical protein
MAETKLKMEAAGSKPRFLDLCTVREGLKKAAGGGLARYLEARAASRGKYDAFIAR